MSASRARWGAQFLAVVIESVGKSVAALYLPARHVETWVPADYQVVDGGAQQRVIIRREGPRKR